MVSIDECVSDNILHGLHRLDLDSCAPRSPWRKSRKL